MARNFNTLEFNEPDKAAAIETQKRRGGMETTRVKLNVIHQ